MDKTLGYLLCCQSPALFLGALALLAGYIIRHRNHRVHAALDLVLAIVCLLGGVALYYLGMLYDHFTIHDFWQIRVPGWVGLVLAAIVIVVLFVQNIGKAAARRRSEKEAARAEDARRKELEEAKSAAFASRPGRRSICAARPAGKNRGKTRITPKKCVRNSGRISLQKSLTESAARKPRIKSDRFLRRRVCHKKTPRAERASQAGIAS